MSQYRGIKVFVGVCMHGEHLKWVCEGRKPKEDKSFLKVEQIAL